MTLLKFILLSLLAGFSSSSFLFYKKIEEINSKLLSNESTISLLVEENKILKESYSKLETALVAQTNSNLVLKTNINEVVPAVVSQTSANIIYVAIGVLVVVGFLYLNLPTNATIEQLTKNGAAEAGFQIAENTFKGNVEINKIISSTLLEEINRVEKVLLQQTDNISLKLLENQDQVLSLLKSVNSVDPNRFSFNTEALSNGPVLSSPKLLISFSGGESSAATLTSDALCTRFIQASPETQEVVCKISDYVVPVVKSFSEF